MILGKIVIITIVALLIIVGICIPKIRDACKTKKIKSYVSWCLSEKNAKEYNANSPSLICYILKAQDFLNIRQDFAIHRDKDSLFINKIIDEYKKDLMQSFLNGNLYIPKGYDCITNDEFFIYTLFEFLMKRQYDRKFSGYDMLGNELDRIYFSDGSLNIIYSLSDFSILYHKVLYIAYLYSEMIFWDPTQPSSGKSWIEESLTNILKTKQIELEY